MSISKAFKYRNLFLLVRIRSGGFRLTLPMALFLLDETFDIIGDMLWLAEKFIPKRFYRQYLYHRLDGNPKINESMNDVFPPRQILKLCRELMNELRRHGRYSLLEAEVGKGSCRQYVTVKFL